MGNRRQLLNYLPPFMQEYIELQEIMAAEQPEFDLLWDAVETALKEQYIHSAEDYGLTHWERILEITPLESDTLDERRFRILTLLNSDRPYTMRKLEQLLSTFCGEENYQVALEAYSLWVQISQCSESQRTAIYKMLKKMVPANIWMTLEYFRDLQPAGEIVFGAASEYASEMDIWPLVVREIESSAELWYGAGSEVGESMKVLPLAAKSIESSGEMEPAGALSYTQMTTLEIYPQGGTANG